MSAKKLLIRVFRIVCVPPLWLLGHAAYDGKYLTGRHFDQHISGWIKVWSCFWLQKVLGFNRRIPWPMPPFSRVTGHQNVEFHPDDISNFWHFGCYFQAIGAPIKIGRGTYIAPNVGIVTTNHDVDDLARHAEGRAVTIGERCWIGMNSMVLPGVTLGPNTIVAAGAVVSKSFPDGYVVVGGVPAKVLKELPREG